jgi:tetratricopeptide (TPR) repeat protein
LKFLFILAFALATALYADFASDFAKAKALFDRGAFADAQKAFLQLYAEKMDDPSVNFYLGAASYELKDYDRAIAAYERILVVDENNLRAQLEIGRVYFAMRLFPQARRAFEQVLRNPLPDSVRDSVRVYLSAIATGETEKYHFFDGSLSVGYFHDTNAKNGSGFEHDFFGKMNEPEKSGGLHSSCQLRHRYVPKGIYSQSSRVALQMQRCSDVENVDVFYAAINTEPQITINDVSYSLPIGADKLYYDDKSYLTTPSIGLKVSSPIAARTLLSLEYGLSDKRNAISANKKRDALNHALTLAAMQMVGRDTLLNGSIAYGVNRKKRGDYLDVDTDTIALKIGAFHTLSADFTANAGASYKRVTYKDKPLKVESFTLFGTNTFEEREENTLGLNAGINYRLYKTIYAQAQVNYSKQSSSDRYYEYDKVVTSAGLLAAF